MLKLSVLIVLVLAAFASQDTPIPSRPDGYGIGSNTPTLHIEAFYDLLCPDSRDSWGVLQALLVSEYHIATNQTLRFTAHIFPLPYHINAFMAAQGARVIADNLAKPADIWTYIDLVFASQTLFYNAATANLTQEQVQDKLSGIVNKAMPAYAGIFEKGLEYGTPFDSEARIAWKYGCSRGVTGAPVYLANGVAIDGADSFTAAQWRNFLNGGYISQIYL